MWQEKLGSNLETARVRKGLSLGQASTLLGYDDGGSVLSDYERGEIENMEIDEIVLAASIYNTSVSKLLDGVFTDDDCDDKTLDISECTEEEVNILKSFMDFFKVVRRR